MTQNNNQDFYRNLQLFRSLFKGREDVFAIRWEKPGSASGGKTKSGYMPAYFFDPYRYRTHQLKGGSFQNFTEKKYLPLTDEQFAKHLTGEHLIGVYPLLTDNTSWFIAADFDGKNWAEDSRKFLACSILKNVPVYLERSRSGNGGHIWIFFDRPYTAFKSRKIVQALLVESGVISVFDRNSSFDRLFPNQDTLSGKGLGNLIALPLNRTSFLQGNNCFVDPDTLQVIPDQWRFISLIQRIRTEQLDEIYHSFADVKTSSAYLRVENNNTEQLHITLNNVLRLNRATTPLTVINFLRKELNFANEEFSIKKKIGKNTFGVERYFRFIQETEKDIIIPRGFAGRLLRFCRDTDIPCSFADDRKKKTPVSYNFKNELKPYQLPAFEASKKKDMGVIVAPPGSGKTIIGLKIIADKQQPALIVVHRKQLADQWVERIEAFLGIPGKQIGKIFQGKSIIGKQITVATIQSIVKEMDKPDRSDLKDAFGIIIVDECHHIPAETYRRAIQQFNSYFLYGLTATPFRKYNDGKLIFIHLGEVINEIASIHSRTAKASIVIRDTSLEAPFNSKTDRFETLSKILVHDSVRNKLIIQDINTELSKGNRLVILTERIEHIDALHLYLKSLYEVLTLSGEDSETNRVAKWKLLKAGNYQALITTGQFFGEGTDLQNASCLFLVYPFSFEGKLIQYIGRVQRSEIVPTIYDYRDIKIDYLNRMFLKRNVYYRKLVRQASLFDDVNDEEIQPEINTKTIVIDKDITVAIEILEFIYGGIAFIHQPSGFKEPIKFELEHEEIRPEFEVLKPYFAKTLRSKNIKVKIYAEFENGKLVSQMAISDDLKKINRKIIESVRFQFFTKPLMVRQIRNPENESAEHIYSGHPLYESGEVMLEDMLSHTRFKHNRHLRFLAEKHAGHILKVRFVLQPFSFVFLLEGEEQFHIVLETLDTEEASYIWHFTKNIPELMIRLREIDRYLGIIRKRGRQNFLTNPPENFNRVIHDYSDNQKGFIVWKDQLMEQIV